MVEIKKEKFSQLINEPKLISLEETLASGGVANHEQYQRVVGEISGLRSAEQEIIDLQKNMEKEVDD